MKKSILAIMIIMPLLFLAGCAVKHDRGDVEEYVSSNLGLSGFTVSRTSTEVTSDDDGYTDYLWEVTESDGTVFYVLDDFFYESEWKSNMLTSNWNEVHLKEYLADADLDGFEMEEVTQRSRNYPCMKFTLLTGTYSNRSELHEYAEKLNSLADGSDLGLTLIFDIRYDSPYRYIGQGERYDGMFSGRASRDKHADYSDAEGRMLELLLERRDEERLKEFTDDEIHDYVGNSSRALGVRQDDGTWKMFDDLIGNTYRISYPTFYEVLIRCGYPVTGTKDDFTFTGVDGSVYEFSESFVEDDRYYYLKDGGRINAEWGATDDIGRNLIREAAGIEIAQRKTIEEEK
ncbi:MAG: hypothetical protein ACSW8G_03205 [Bacillota bacterium]